MFQKVRDSINALSWLHKTSEIIAGLVVPVLVGLVATFQEKIIAASPFLFWALLIALGVMALVLTLASTNVKSAPEVYLDWQIERDANARMTKDIRYGALLEAEILAMNGLVRGYAAERITSRGALSEAIGNVCGGFVEERNAYFNFEHGEMWNFAVYLWNDPIQRLEPLWREKARNHPSKGPGRVWGSNEGHIGHAFRTRRELITSDAQMIEVAALMAGVGNEQPYDAQTYKSYVSEPILAQNPASRPFGVLVATSNRVGRFDPANSRILKHAAVALATLMEAAYDSP
ncbi:MAG TPA: GAF domain-containing protein [Rhizomicrobium sp.]